MSSSYILSDNGASSGSAGIKQFGGNDGVLLLQTSNVSGTPTTAISISNTQVVTYTNQPTYTGGTANGVLYLNGSKAVTSGTALVFDGTNLGVGVTPSAWLSTRKVIQNGNAALVSATSVPAFLQLSANTFTDSSGIDKYISTAAATNYAQVNGQHQWFYAASGSAGATATFTQAMTLDTSGTLGVGTTSPFNPGGAGQKGIEIAGSDYGTLYVTSNSRAVTGFLGAETSASLVNVGSRTNHPFILQTNSLERARIDTSGNFMVGQTSSSNRLSVTATGSSNTGVLALNATDTSTTFVWASQSFISGMTAGQNFIHMIGKSGSTKNSGYIGYKWAANASDSNLLTFGHYGSDNLVNIDAVGNLLVNTTTRTAAGINASGTLQVNREMMAVGSLAGIFWENRSGSVTLNSNWYGWYATGSTILLYNGNANIASINTTSGAYTALSDANKKKDFEDSGIGLAAVMQLKPTLFRMLDDAEDAPKQLGFIAQEVNEVIPQAYVESTMVDAGGKNSTYIGLNDRPIIAALTKAIQELKAEIDALKGQA